MERRGGEKEEGVDRIRGGGVLGSPSLPSSIRRRWSLLWPRPPCSTHRSATIQAWVVVVVVVGAAMVVFSGALMVAINGGCG
jgi:hypothetical protein